MLAYKSVSDFSVIGVDIIYIFNSEMCNMNNSKPIRGGGHVPLIFLKNMWKSLLKKQYYCILLPFKVKEGLYLILLHCKFICSI